MVQKMSGRTPSLRTLERVAKVAQNVTIIAGVFAGVVTVLATQHDRRVQRTLDLRKEYVDGARKTYLELLDNWNTYSAKPENDVLKLKQAEQRLVTRRFFEVSKNRTDFNNLVDFFETLSVCIEHKGCDKNTAIDLFGSQAKSVYELGWHYVEDLRKEDNDPSIAEGLRLFRWLGRQSLLSSYL